MDWFLHMSPPHHHTSSTRSICFVLLKCTFMLAFANCSFYLTQRLIAGTCSSGHGAHQRQNDSQQHSVDYSGISSQAPTLSPPWSQTRVESISWAQAPDGRVTELQEKKKKNREDEKWRGGNERKVRDWKKRGWKALVFGLIIRFQKSDGCGWICIA